MNENIKVGDYVRIRRGILPQSLHNHKEVLRVTEIENGVATLEHLPSALIQAPMYRYLGDLEITYTPMTWEGIRRVAESNTEYVDLDTLAQKPLKIDICDNDNVRTLRYLGIALNALSYTFPIALHASHDGELDAVAKADVDAVIADVNRYATLLGLPQFEFNYSELLENKDKYGRTDNHN
jgi:hypothetical protein